MKLKLSIIIFTAILSIFYLQIVSCKKNPENPKYDYYTGFLIYGVPGTGMVKHDHYDFYSQSNNKTYYIVVQSDIDKLKPYFNGNQKIIITIKATYSNQYKGYTAINGYMEDFLYDVTFIAAIETNEIE